MPKNDEPLKRLRDFEALEVSLVERPANRRRYLMMKSQKGGMDMDITVLNEILTNTRAEAEDQLDEVLLSQGVSAEVGNALRGSLRMLEAYGEELPDELLVKMAGLIGGAELLESM